jgi:hypothetical protein
MISGCSRRYSLTWQGGEFVFKARCLGRGFPGQARWPGLLGNHPLTILTGRGRWTGNTETTRRDWDCAKGHEWRADRAHTPVS